MGMAASQARLLTITARLADNELRSQTINNAKMRLATQSSQASENYINALNNATKTFTNYDLEGESVSQALTYNALTAYSSYNTQYGLVNSSGQLLVSESEAAIFANCGNNLSNFLKAHGLEYRTSYFEELGGFTHSGYPEPYNNMSVEDLEDWYSKYTSFENSVEVENFEKAVATFANADGNLYKAGNQIMKEFLLSDHSGVADLIYTEGGFTLKNLADESGNESLYDLLGYDEDTGFGYKVNMASGTAPYGLTFLNANSYINSETYQKILDEINHYSIVHDNNGTAETGDDCDKLKMSEEITPKKIDNSSGLYTTYYFDDGFSLNITGSVITSWDCTKLEEDEYNRTTDELGNTTQDIQSFTNNGVIIDNGRTVVSYTVTDNDGQSITHYYGYEKVNGEDKFYSYAYLPLRNDDERNAIKEELGNSINYIIQTILDEANYEKFANDIVNGVVLQVGTETVSLKDVYGLTAITKAGNKTLSTILEEYIQAKQGFIPAIFKDTSTVESDMAAGTTIKMYDGDGNVMQVEKLEGSSGTWQTVADERVVDADNLRDIEFILQYAKQKGLEFTEDFNTVIKEYIMDSIIEVNGTPKFAWIDENDPSNTGNADAKAQWYTNIFNRMQQGYKQIEDGLASSKEWIEYALESGIVTMEQVDKYFNWKSLDYKTCTRITEVTDDAAVAKAEAEYNRAMNDIKAKDNIYDLQLKNIDTEHTSLQTEYSVLEKVIQKNIERTFKFDQSA